MNARLLRNGNVFCELVPSTIHPLPPSRKGEWRDCVVVTRQRMEPSATDVYAIQTEEKTCIPFHATRTRIGIEGWEVVGQLLY